VTASRCWPQAHGLPPDRLHRRRSALVDAASWERNTERARAIVLTAAQRGVVNTRGLREALTHHGVCRHRALIVAAYLDVWWRGLNLAVEIHGIPHMRVENRDSDLMRLNEMVIDGRRTLVFSSHAIRRHPERVAN
jgi:very-short-patch-repair endonuclease